MKQLICLIGKIDLTSRNIREVVINNAEPVYTREYTDRMVKILKSNYSKEYLEQVSTNTTQLNY